MNGREKSHSAIAARKKKKEKCTALLHHLAVDSLEERASSRAFAGSPGSVSGAAEPAGLYSQAGAAASADDRRAGRPNRPRSDGDGAERHLRGGLPRLQLRIPIWTRPVCST